MESVRASVIENEQIAKDTYKITLKSEIAAQMQPGQFVKSADQRLLSAPSDLHLRDRGQRSFCPHL